jgi:hypothetical protein
MQALKNMDVVITVVVVVLCLLRLYTSHLAERQEQAAWRKRKLFSHNKGKTSKTQTDVFRAQPSTHPLHAVLGALQVLLT